jgi:transposase
MAYDHIVLYPVNPKSAASFRETFYPSGKKDDPVDSDVLLELIYKHEERLKPLDPADPATRSLVILSEHRRKLVHDVVRTTNRLRANLKSYFPQAFELVGELDSPMSCEFLKEWPSLTEVKRARPATLRKFYHSHGSRSKARIDARLALLPSAVALTNDLAVVESGIAVTRSLVRVITALVESIREIEAHQQSIYSTHPEHDLSDSFPGLGPVFGARIAALLGSDRDRFASHVELQLLTGVAPVTKSSGGRKGVITVHRRLKRSKFLHQTVVEWAGQSIKNSAWARAFYNMKRAAGHGRWAALRALGFKWLRILFRCWKEEIHYDEATHLKALKERGSPVVAYFKEEKAA